MIAEVPVPVEVIREKIDTIYIEKPVLFGINFEFNKYDITPSSVPILEHAVEVLHQNPYLTVKISGYTDSIGTDNYNYVLSERRAKTVYEYFLNKGISSGRLSIAAYGKQFYIRKNDSPENRAFNRRVVLEFEDIFVTSGNSN